MPADSQHQDYKDHIKEWELIDTLKKGKRGVLAAKKDILPDPNPEALDINEAQARYDAYLKNAVLFNFTKRTIDTLLGIAFAKEITLEIPPELEELKDNINGQGLSIEQLFKRGVEYNLSYGFGGFYSDYPINESENLTLEQIRMLNLRPIVEIVKPHNIINWRQEKIGGKLVLSLVVLQEDYVDFDDGFEEKTKIQHKVLKIENGVYYVEIYRENELYDIYQPRLSNRLSIDSITFEFFGADNNDLIIDESPMSSIAHLQCAHLRNSADYEESVHILGQPTLSAAEQLTQDTLEWIEKKLGGKITFGATSFLPFKAEIIQPAPNTMAFEAMKNKEEQAKALGAQLLDPSSVMQTATEYAGDQKAELSQLGLVVENAKLALEEALFNAAKFINANVQRESIKIDIETDYSESKLNPQEMQQLFAMFSGNLISRTEARAKLKPSGFASLEDEDAFREIESSSMNLFNSDGNM